MTNETATQLLTEAGMLAGLATLPPAALIGTREQLAAAEPARDALIRRLDRDIGKNGCSALAVLSRAVIGGHAAQPTALSHSWRDADWWGGQAWTSQRRFKDMARRDLCERRARVLVDLGAVRLLASLSEEECSPRAHLRFTTLA